MAGQRIRVLGMVLVWLVAGCAMEYAKDVGFIDQAIEKDIREEYKTQRLICPPGQQLKRAPDCKGDPNCKSECVESR